MKRITILGIHYHARAVKPAELPFTLDYFDAAGNLIAFVDLASGRQTIRRRATASAAAPAVLASWHSGSRDA